LIGLAINSSKISISFQKSLTLCKTKQMQIVNPIYDVVFKLMMQDLRIAKFFISTIIDENIEEIEPCPQEKVYTSETLGLSVLRFDYSAKVKTGTGAYKTILIEVQKSQDSVDLMRFRNYLAEQYKKEETIIERDGRERKDAIPIITIYMLGFSLKDLKYCIVKANREYIDLETGKKIEGHCEFIEKLTHDGYFVQLPRLEPRLQTKLGRLLSIFEQKYFVGQLNEKKEWIKEYTYEISEPDLQYTLDLLQKSVGNAEVIEKIEHEEQVRRALEMAAQNKRKELEKQLEVALQGQEEERLLKEKALQRQEEERLLKEKALQSQEEERLLKEKALQSQEEERQQKEEALFTIKKIVKQLYDKSIDVPEIAKMLGKEEQEINDLLKS
jgi:hypothetical protein